MKQADVHDTIVAIATPLGEGAIGMVRMSGADALRIADRIFRGKRKPSRCSTHTVNYGWIKSGKKKIDEVLLTVMRAPRTYTREHVVEISCHGGVVALRNILELVIRVGARIAEPGEFTKRAFLNGRIDLSQAEAVLGIIRAKTEAALKLNTEQLSGRLARIIGDIRRDLIDVLAHIEAGIDFSDHNITTKTYATLQQHITPIQKQLQKICDDARAVQFFREGIKVTICGRPNVGKSSLLNALLRKERAIVTPIAGTTRDIIEEFITINGLGVRLVDTAGMIQPKNIVDHHAIRLTKDSIALSDIVLLVFDASETLTLRDKRLIRDVRAKDVIAVINKIDLPVRLKTTTIRKHFRQVVRVSSLKQRNLEGVERAIATMAYRGTRVTSEGLVVTNLRQLQEIRTAIDLLQTAHHNLKRRLSLEFVALDVKFALECLGRITGESVDNTILEKIFSEFCIGK